MFCKLEVPGATAKAPAASVANTERNIADNYHSIYGIRNPYTCVMTIV